jgi:hypothetical protein
MSTAYANPQRRFEQRLLLLGFVVALVLAPVLANIWPAFGKGRMLYVGTTATTQVDAGPHAGHEGHAAPASQSHDPQHQQHCALCVLAFLGWAPPVDLSLDCEATCAVEKALPITAQVPHLTLVWPGAQARAPPLS